MLAAAFAGVPPDTARAAVEPGTTETRLEFASGADAPNIGDADPDFDYSANGTSWVNAVRATPHPAWGTVPRAEWISRTASGNVGGPADTDHFFRVKFTVPPGVSTVDVEYNLLADNWVDVKLGPTALGGQPHEPRFENFQTVLGSVFGDVPVQPGDNDVIFTVRNASDPTALSVLLVIEYTAVQTDFGFRTTDGAVGAHDPVWEYFPADGTLSPRPAVAAVRHPAYATMPRSGWISTRSDARPDGASPYRFRARIGLPASTKVKIQFQVHADNRAVFFFNGQQIAAQPNGGFANFQGVPEVYSAVVTSLANSETNEVGVALHSPQHPAAFNLAVDVTHNPWTCAPGSDGQRLAEDFVDLWEGRVTGSDDGFDHARFPTRPIPRAIRDEGFHDGRSDTDKQCWISRLDDHYRRTVPGYADQPMRAAAAALFSYIFDHPDRIEPVPDQGTPLKEIGTTPAEAILNALGSLVNHPPTVASVLAAPPVRVPAVSELAAPLPVELRIPVLQTIDGLVNRARAAVESAYYRVCSMTATASTAVCSDPPTAVNAPTTINPSGRLYTALLSLTPAGGSALQYKFDLCRGTMIVPAAPVASSCQDAGSTENAQAHVWVELRAAGVDAALQFGYDGRPTGLARRSTASFTVRDAAEAGAGAVVVDFDVRHQGLQRRAGISFGYAALKRNGSASDPPVAVSPITALVDLDGMPDHLGGTFRVFGGQRSRAPDTTDLELELDLDTPAGAPPRPALLLVDVRPASDPGKNRPDPRTQVLTEIAGLPDKIFARLSAAPTKTDAAYNGRDELGRPTSMSQVNLALIDQPDVTGAPTTMLLARGSFSNVPSNLQVTVDNEDTVARDMLAVRYQSSPWSTGQNPVLDVRVQRVEADVIDADLRGHVVDVPTLAVVTVEKKVVPSGVRRRVVPPVWNNTISYNVSRPVTLLADGYLRNRQPDGTSRPIRFERLKVVGAPSQGALTYRTSDDKRLPEPMFWLANGPVTRIEMAGWFTDDAAKRTEFRAELRGVPDYFSILAVNDDRQFEIRFDAASAGAPATIESVVLELTNTGSFLHGDLTKAHAYVSVSDDDSTPGQHLEAELALAGIKSFSLKSFNGRADVGRARIWSETVEGRLETLPAAGAVVDMSTVDIKAHVAKPQTYPGAGGAFASHSVIDIDAVLRPTEPATKALPDAIGFALASTQYLNSRGQPIGAKEAPSLTITTAALSPSGAATAALDGRIVVGERAGVIAGKAQPRRTINGLLIADSAGPSHCGDPCKGMVLTIGLAALPARTFVAPARITTSLPTTAEAVVVEGLRQPGGELIVELALDDGSDATTDLKGAVVVKGLPASVDIGLASLRTLSQTAYSEIGLGYRANAPAGPLVVDLVIGDNAAPDEQSRVVVKAATLPQSVQFDVAIRDDARAQTGTGNTWFRGQFGTAPGALDASIGDLDLAIFEPATGPAAIALGAHNVPPSVYGELMQPAPRSRPGPCDSETPARVPGFHYRALSNNPDLSADGLDLTARFDFTPATPGDTQLVLDVTDIGRNTTFQQSGDESLSVTSTPPSGKLTAHVLRLAVNVTVQDLGAQGNLGCPKSIIEFDGKVNLLLLLDLSLSVTGVPSTGSTMTLRAVPGLSTKVDVEHVAEVRLAATRATANLRFENFRVYVNAPLGGGGVGPKIPIQLFNLTTNPRSGVPVRAKIHVARNESTRMLALPLGVPCPVAPSLVYVVLDGRPTLHSAPRWDEAIVTPMNTTTKSTWVLTVDPYLRDYGVYHKLFPALRLGSGLPTIDSVDLIATVFGGFNDAVDHGITPGGPFGLPLSCGVWPLIA